MKIGILFIAGLLSFSSAFSQLSGTFSIPTDYASLSAFATALNTVGVGPGGVTLNVPAGYTESVTAPILFTTTGSTGNEITIVKSGAGANPVISRTDAGTLVTTTLGAQGDAVLIVEGSDFITFDGIDVSASNQGIEYGYYLRKASVTNGCKNVTIKNANVTMTKGTSQYVVGIYTSNNDASSLVSSATGITVTSIDGRNENISILGNTISNVFSGIVTRGFNHTTAPNDFYDNNFTIGAVGQGNTIQNYAGNAVGTAYGVYNIYYKNFNINYNTINNIQGGGANATSTIYGIFSSNSTTSGNLNYLNNTITLNQGSTSAAHGLYISGAASNLNISANGFEYGAFASTTTSYMIYASNNSSNMTVDGNYNSAPIVKTGAGTFYGYYDFGSPTSGTATVSNNTFSDITLTGASTFYGIYHATSTTQIIKMLNNSVNTIQGTTNTAYGLFFNYGNAGSEVSGNTVYDINTGGIIYGINVGTTSSLGLNLYNNTVNGLTSSGASNVSGLYIQGGNPANYYQNRIYNLQSNNAGGTVNGIWISGGVVVNVYNNLIGDLKAPIGTSATNADIVRGISITSTTAASNLNIYYNSIYLNATSTGANFSSSGIFHTVSATATTATLDLRNNIIINESAPTGTGTIAAYRRSGISLTNYSSNSNRNLFFAGTPDVNKLIFTDGTTPQQTMLGYQTAVAPRDVNSFTSEGFAYGTAGSFFVSLTPTSVDYLRPVNGLTTLVESGAINISVPAITTDFVNSIRGGNAGYTGTGTAPDLGAYEFSGTSPAPSIALNSVTPPATAQCTTSPRLVSVNVTTPSGTITNVVLNYAFNGVAQTAITMTNTTGSTWEGTLPASTPVNATVTWSVSALNSVPLGATYTGSTYSDEPLTGVSGVALVSNDTLCAGDATTLTAILTAPGIAQVGNATTTTSTAGITPFSSSWEGSREQYLVKATELSASGLLPGAINSLGFFVSSTGTFNMSNYSIKIAHTNEIALGAATGAYGNPSGAFTTVYTNAAEAPPTVGLKTFTFTTPFVWDGISNILIDICHDNDINATCTNCYGSNSGVRYTATTFNSIWGSYNDNAQSCGLQAANTITNRVNRPNLYFNGLTNFPTSGVVWNDGLSNIGTANPLTVNPLVTTTYTATVSGAGCALGTSPSVLVTVNPLPSAPTASNSLQCGTQIPTATVTSTSGLISPIFKWYDAATAGNLLQNSASTTYNSNVAATATFYVSELNTVTGCESPRTPVTVTVQAADGISASATTPTTICIGGSVSLSASNSNPTPNQTYTYTWSGTAGSGLTSSTGSTLVVTPTLPGTYTIDLSGVDGGCNAVSQISITVDPFVATVTPVAANCNGVADGTFTLNTSACGTQPYTYSIDGGATFTVIPTNLAAGTYNVIIKDANNYMTTGQTIIITEPSTTVSIPTVTDALVCVGDVSANIGASSFTSVPTPGSITVSFDLSAQPTEVSGLSSFPTVAANPNIIMTATMAALPAGATITGATFTYPGLTALGGSWRSDMGFGFTGAVTEGYAAGNGAAGSAGVFDYTRTLTAGSISAAGGVISVHYYDLYNDNTTSAEATFPTGNGIATLVINYTTPSPATISWWDAPSGGNQLGTGSSLNAVGTSVLPNTNTAGVYTLYAQGQNGACPSPSRGAATVTINALPVVDAGADQTVCSGTSVTLNGSGTNTYSWNNGVSDGISFSPSNTTVYTVTGTNTSTGCSNTDQVTVNVNALPIVNAGLDTAICFGQPVSLVGSGASTYTWDNGVNNTVAFTPSTTSNYVVSGTDVNGCIGTDTVSVTVYALPNIFAGLDTTLCSGSSITLTGSGGVSYSWNNGIQDGVAFAANSNASYTVTGTDANGCINTDDVAVNTYALPNVNAGSDFTVCQNAQISLNASGASTYTWNNNVVNGVPFAITNTNTYAVVGTDVNGCQATDSITVSTNALPNVDAGNSISQCGDQTVTLSASGAVTYVWNNSVQNNVPFQSPIGTTSYIVTGIDAFGCSNTDIVNVTINAIPSAQASAANAVTLVASPSNSYYQWINCSDNTPILGATGSTFTATENGNYAVIITGNGGCSDTSDCIVVDQVGLSDLGVEFGLEVYPNPTRDNFFVYFTKIESLTLNIYDLQGKLIVMNKTIQSGDQVDLSKFENGVYTIEMTDENQQAIVRRIIKN